MPLGKQRRVSHLVLAHVWIAGVGVSSAHAVELKYPSRTRPYNGLSSTVRGDTRTVGMGGATLGLADTFLAAKDNPAGLAMTLSVGDDNYTRTQVMDSHIQDSVDSIETFNAGIAANIDPWGFSFGYFLPYSEMASDANSHQFSVEVEELRLGAARVFWENRLSLGLSLNLAKAETELVPQYPSAQPALANRSYSWGVTGGAMLQLPNRLLLALSASTPMTFSKGDSENAQSSFPGFFQEVKIPWQGGVGLGWIPNRFFRTDLSVFAIGSTPEAALLKDQSKAVGAYWTLQPRVGAAYVFCDFRNLRGTAFAGGYYEVSRIQDAHSRLHKTAGIEIKPWVFTVGIGTDVAEGFENHFASVNLDVFKVMEQLSLIPSSPVPRNGFLPNPYFQSDVGLAKPLVKTPVAQAPAIDPIKTGLAIPKKIEKALNPAEGGGPDDLAKDALDTIKKLPEKLENEFEEMKKAQDRKTESEKPH